MTSENLSIRSEAVKSFFSKIASSGIGFLGIVIFANFLGAERLGYYFFAFALVQLVGIHFAVGIGMAIRKRTSEKDTTIRKASEMAISGGIIFIVYCTVIMFALLVALPLWKGYVGGIHIAVLTILSIPSMGTFVLARNLLSGQGDPGFSDILFSLRQVAIVVLQVLLLLIGFGVVGLMIALVTIPPIWSLIILYFADFKIVKPSIKSLKSLTDFAKWSIPNTLFVQGFDRFDPIVIGILVGSAAVGHFQSAVKLLLPTVLLAAAIGQAASVKISGKHSRGNTVKSEVSYSLSYAGLLSIPAFFGSLVLGNQVMVTFFGSTFSGTGWILQGVALFYTFITFRKQLTQIVYGLNEPKIIFKIQGLMFVIHVLVAIPLVLKFGVLGVIISSTTIELLSTIYYYHVVTNLVENLTYPKSVNYQVFSGIALSIVVFTFVSIISVNNWIILGIAISLGGFTYFTSVIILDTQMREKLKTSFLKWVKTR